MTFSIFSCFLYIQPVVFKPSDKSVILRACDFSIFSCFLYIQPVVFRPSDKAVILSACDFFDLSCFSAYSTSCIQAPRQNRHPERSASQIDRVTQRLWRGVEGPRRRLITPGARSFSTTGPDNGTCCDTHLMVTWRVCGAGFGG